MLPSAAHVLKLKLHREVSMAPHKDDVMNMLKSQHGLHRHNFWFYPLRIGLKKLKEANYRNIQKHQSTLVIIIK